MHYPDGVSDVTDPRGDLQWETLPGLVHDAAARLFCREGIHATGIDRILHEAGAP